MIIPCSTTSFIASAQKNVEGDLFVMNTDFFIQKKKMLKLREELIAIEQNRLNGTKEYSIQEVDEYLNNIIDEISFRDKKS